MFDTWLSAALLIMESNDVVRLRLLKFAAGGGAAGSEAALMVNEKVAAAFETQTAILNGETIISVIERYREHVAANARRLMA